jgi:hypothetical protein
MSRAKILLSLALFVGCLASDTSMNAADLTLAQIDGRDLAAELLAQKPVENFDAMAVLKKTDRAGARSEIQVRLQVTVSAGSWRSLYTAFDSQHRAVEQFTVLHAEQDPNQYRRTIVLGDQGALAEPVAVPPEQVFTTSFAGSDFLLGDLGLEFFHWPEQRLIKKQMRMGRSCRVLESQNPRPTPATYLRVLSWIDLESGGLIRAEAYDLENKLAKEFTVQSFSKVNDQWQVKKMEIRNLQLDSRTLLVMNFD